MCCLGCAIFGITEVPTDGVEFDVSDFAYTNAEEGKATPGTTTSPVYVPPPPEQQQQPPAPAVAPIIPLVQEPVAAPPVEAPKETTTTDPLAGTEEAQPQEGELHDLD